MENVKRTFDTPEKAEAFLKKLSARFETAGQLFEFSAASIETQAALADWLLKENRFAALQREKYLGGAFREPYSQIEMATAWDEYNRASIEFQLAKRKLQDILNQTVT